MNSFLRYMMKEPHLSKMLTIMVRCLESNIPQMISFLDTDVDLHPWERRADVTYISDTEVEINLWSLMKDMLGHASVPALFGHALLEKYPNIIQDVYEMDKGMYYFLMGLPGWFPVPGLMKAHMARFRLWQYMDDYQRALDATADDRPVDYSWGDFDDVSEVTLKRNAMFKSKKPFHLSPQASG